MPHTGFEDHSDAILAGLGRLARRGSLTDRRHRLEARFRVATDALTLPALAKIKKELTLTPKCGPGGKRKRPSSSKDDPSFPVWVYHGAADGRGAFIDVPRYYGTAAFGIPTDESDRRVLGSPLGADVEFTGQLKSGGPYQVESVSATMAVLTSPLGGAMVQLGCGQGKTVCAIALAVRLGRRTAILVNNGKTLLPQWVERLAQFLPGAKVGIIRGVKNDLADPSVDVVVCLIQSLAKREYAPHLMDTVGTLIVDECHHIGAPVFAQSLRQFRARYTLGLSATPDRKDGLRAYVEWLLGPVVVHYPTDFRRVRVLRYTYTDTKVAAHESARNKDHLQRCLMVNDAVRDQARTLLLLRFVFNIVKESPRHVLVLTERVAQVDDIARHLVGVACSPTSGFTGAVARLHAGVPREEVMAAAGATIVVANYPMASEALDHPHLDTIVCLTPLVGFIEQVVGRVVRVAPRKCVPLVVDLVDPVGLFAGMARTRARWERDVEVAGVKEVAVDKGVLVSQAAYDAVKPSAVAAEWLTMPDPWNVVQD